MTIRTVFFAHYREIVPGGELVLDLPAGATVADAATHLAERNPRLADLLTRTRAAVGTEFADPTTPLKDGDELAFLPPMSGG